VILAVRYVHVAGRIRDRYPIGKVTQSAFATTTTGKRAYFFIVSISRLRTQHRSDREKRRYQRQNGSPKHRYASISNLPVGVDHKPLLMILDLSHAPRLYVLD
jgi:hypothetical protein